MAKVIDKQAFFERIGYKPHNRQWLYHNSRARFKLASCGRRYGKAGPLSTPLLTPNGWTTLGAIQVGDYVYGPDGEPTRVAGKSPVMFGHKCYRVIFDDGAESIADVEHLWAVETYTMRKSRGNGRWNVAPYRVMTTEDLAKRVGKVKYPDSIILTQPVQMPTQKFSIDPYVFGVWLGDGTTGQAQLTCHDDDVQTYQVEFEKVGYGLRKIPSRRQSWKIVGLTKGDCLTKTVPDGYWLGSVEQRLALLQGLMDTDGTVATNVLEFDNTNKDLVDLVEWLVVSLGGRGRRYDRTGRYKDELTGGEYKDCKTTYRFTFNVALPVFRLQRKLAKQAHLRQGPQTVRRYVSSVEPVESVPVQCIKVEREDGLFLWTNSLVMTHNTTMVARDLEPRLFIPNKNYWVIGRCVDEQTRVLTQRGWLQYDEVQVGDETLSINPTTGQSEWDEILEVCQYSGLHKVTRLTTQSFDAVTTGNHRWLSLSTNRQGPESGWVWRTTDTLRPTDRVPRAAFATTNLPTESKYTDEFVELVAWLWTEGGVRGDAYHIAQSRTANPGNFSRIRSALETLCPDPKQSFNRYRPEPYWSEWHNGFYIGAELGREFQKVFEDVKVVRPNFVRSLTRAQLQLFVNVSVLGDGHSETRARHGSYSSNRRVILQDNDWKLFAVQLACTLLGQPTSLKQRGDGQWILALLSGATVSVRNMKRYTYTHNGIVWCVRTRNMNWLAERHGSVYYTGNTYDAGAKEFRVIWDDLIVGQKLGRDKTIKRTFNVKQGDMWIHFPWDTRLEVRSADHPERLVGEALDHVIMSEAAKHREETWNRFVRPALSDTRGTADFPSTPEGYNFFYELWMLGADKTLPEYESWCLPSWENTAVYPGGREDSEIKLLERTMMPEAFMQEIGAEFGSFVGKIYPEWDVTSMVTNVAFRPDLPNYIAFDFGYVNPLAAIEFQVTPDDKIRIWREHYKSYLQLSEHLRLMRAREQPEGYHLDLAFGDAADPEAIATISSELVQCWGLPEAKANWRSGVDLVRSFMQDRETGLYDEFGGPLVAPALEVDFSCKNTIGEFNDYRAPNAPRSGNNVPEGAKKSKDHAMDALRYALVHIFHLGCTTHLVDVVNLNTNTTQGPTEPYREPSLLGGSDESFFTIGDLSRF